MRHDLGRPAHRLFHPVFAFAVAVVAALEPHVAPPWEVRGKSVGSPWEVRGNRLMQHRFHPVAVHDVGGMDHRAEHEAFRILQQMALASLTVDR